LCQKNVDVGIFSATKPEKVTTDDASKWIIASSNPWLSCQVFKNAYVRILAV
jgi:hypothetical protein